VILYLTVFLIVYKGWLYVLFVLAELAEPWRNFCPRGATKMLLFVYQTIAPQYKSWRVLQIFLFIHHVIESRTKIV